MLKRILSVSIISAGLLFGNIQQNLETAVEEYNNENYRQAIGAAKLVLEEDPSNVMANYIVGLIFYGTNNIPYAIKYLEIANNSGDAPEGTAQTLHAAYIYGGMANKALPFFEKEIKVKPKEEFTMLHYGMALQYTGNNKAAIKVYKKLLAQGTTNDMVMFNVGKMFVERKQYLDAKDMFKGINATSAYFTQSQAYLQSIEYMLRPVKVYASLKASSNSNPNSTAASSGDTIESSSSYESILMLTSRDIILGDNLAYTPQYLLYHLNYQKDHAQGNDYYSHMFKPVRLNYTLDNKLSIFTDVKYNVNYLDYKKYSNQYGVQLGINNVTETGKILSLSLGIDKFDYRDEDNSYNNSLRYDLKLNANDLIKNDYNIQFGVNYTLSYNDPIETSNLNTTTSNKAKDSQYIANAVSTDIMVPLSGSLEDFSLLGNASYSITDYTNTQTGDLYAKMAGQKLETDFLDMGLIVRYNLSREYNTNLDLGFQRAVSSSNEDSLDYSNKKYFVGISYYY